MIDMDWIPKEQWLQNHPNNWSKMNDLAQRIQHLVDPFCTKTLIAGSLRREKPIVNDIDIVAFLPVSKGMKLLNAINKSKLQVKGFGDIDKDKIMNIDFVVPQDHPFNKTGKEQKGQIFCTFDERWLGGLYLHRTGSMDFNVYMSYTARQRGLKLSMYGLFDRETSEFLVGTEEEIFQKMHILFVYPKNRNLGWLKHMGWWRSEHRYKDLQDIGVIKPKVVTKE